MTPAARYAAAIDILDVIASGQPAEKSLTNWARGNRFAGSKDRAAIRDHVYDVLRARRSLAAQGGGSHGRALILGLLRREGISPDTVFGAGGYGPKPLTEEEVAAASHQPALSDAARYDIPDWLWPMWQTSLGEHAQGVAKTLQTRAAVILRANLSKANVADIIGLLDEDGIVVRPVDGVKTALEVTENPRKVNASRAYQEGFVELQDTASQNAMLSLPIARGSRVLDYCAGGGGKALALADMHAANMTAHDIAEKRLQDIPVRAARAGVAVQCASRATLDQLEKFDAVLCDAPCSGSGTWRRTPESKWMLTEEKLQEYNASQADVLAEGTQYVRSGGLLAYATCSVLKLENDDVVTAFLAQHPGWSTTATFRLRPEARQDGFFMVVFQSD